MLHIQNVSKFFDNNIVVDHISFNAVKGHILGFLGPNGAGKSTTMRMITGALLPDTGNIFVSDINVVQNPVEAKKYIGYLPEGAPLYGDMTPREYLNFIINIKHIPRSKKISELDNIIHSALIESVLDNPIHTLSKGYKRRVALAAALIGDPEILILDEPTDGLDPNQKRHIRNLLKKLSKNKTIIISTHILEEVEAICNKTIIINKGRIVASATPRELMTMAPSYNAVVLIVQTKMLDSCMAKIKLLPLTHRVAILKKMPHWTKIIVYPKDKKYIINQISEIVNQNNFQVAEIRCDTGSIEDVFKELTYG